MTPPVLIARPDDARPATAGRRLLWFALRTALATAVVLALWWGRWRGSG